MTDEELAKLTKQELLWELQRLRMDTERMSKNTHKLRRGFFDIIRGHAGMHKDKQGDALWDAIEAELKKSDGMIEPPTGKPSPDEGLMIMGGSGPEWDRSQK